MAVPTNVLEARTDLQAPVTTVATTTAATIVAANNSRISLFVQNKGPNDIYNASGATATTSSFKLGVGKAWEFWPVPTDAVSVRTVAGTADVVSQEGLAI
jgi:hypothetical protein